MSHISKIELEVKDLTILSQACAQMGLCLIRDQKSYRWYGEKAQCDHAICVPGADYEVGVVRADGHYELKCDFYDRQLAEAIGKKGGLLKQAYAVAKTKIEARRKGCSVLERRTETGIRLSVRVT